MDTLSTQVTLYLIIDVGKVGIDISKKRSTDWPYLHTCNGDSSNATCCPLASSHRGSCVTDLLPLLLFIFSFSSAADVYVISVEQLLSKVVETYLSEKHALEKQLSSSLDVPVAAGDVESHLGPAITVQPSSTVTVEPSTDNYPHSEEQKEEEGAANVKEEEKTEAQEQKEGLLAESLMAKVILYTLY